MDIANTSNRNQREFSQHTHFTTYNKNIYILKNIWGLYTKNILKTKGSASNNICKDQVYDKDAKPPVHSTCYMVKFYEKHCR